MADEETLVEGGCCHESAAEETKDAACVEEAAPKDEPATACQSCPDAPEEPGESEPIS